MIGQSIAHYTITEKIGKGAMGEVYRARDSELDRDVALKLLPEALAADSQYLARFEREARVLAALDHPNIGAIYGIEEEGTSKALVLQLIEGPTLADRIGEGPIPLEEALRIALQIAEGLEAAHERGVIHRDLKPDNIKITPGGQVKVLDFGLAKTLAEEKTTGEIADSPTLAGLPTQAGVILGTPAYMSPEQARSEVVDGRTDIWAFGCVLYEMLAGNPPFAGDSFPDVLAAAVTADPDWTALPQGSPASLLKLVKRCLSKSLSGRLRHIGDARLEIEDLLDSPNPVSPIDSSRNFSPAVWIGGLALVVLAALMAGWLSAPLTPPSGQDRLSINIPPEIEVATEYGLDSLALSPDGRTVFFVGRTESGTRLYRRDLEGFAVNPIPDTEGALSIALSPDGTRIAYSTGRQLRMLRSGEGRSKLLCQYDDRYWSPSGRSAGISWTPMDTLLLGSREGGVFEVSSSGGPLRTLISSDESLLWPEMLPEGEILVTIDPATAGRSTIGLYRPTTGKIEPFLENAYAARFLPSGHILFVRDATFYAVPIDTERLVVVGDEQRILERAQIDLWGDAGVAFSANGTLVHVVARPSNRLVWLRMDGRVEPITTEPRGFQFPRISPDGSRVALTLAENSQQAVHVYDLERRVLRTMVNEGRSDLPLWSSNGTLVFSMSRQRSPWHVYSIDVTKMDAPRQLTIADLFHLPTATGPGGRIVYRDDATSTWMTQIASPRDPELLLDHIGERSEARLSPRGDYLAYNKRGGLELQVFVQPLRREGAEIQVSTDGGHDSLWAPDGKRIYYRRGRSIMAADFDPVEGRPVGRPRELFVGPDLGDLKYYRSWDIHPSGDRFIAVEQTPVLTELAVLEGWVEELERVVPREQ